MDLKVKAPHTNKEFSPSPGWAQWWRPLRTTLCQPQVPAHLRRRGILGALALFLEMTMPWKVTVQTHMQGQRLHGCIRKLVRELYRCPAFLRVLAPSSTPSFPLMRSAPPWSSFLCCAINHQEATLSVQVERSPTLTSEFPGGHCYGIPPNGAWLLSQNPCLL